MRRRNHIPNAVPATINSSTAPSGSNTVPPGSPPAGVEVPDAMELTLSVLPVPARREKKPKPDLVGVGAGEGASKVVVAAGARRDMVDGLREAAGVAAGVL